MLRLQNIQKSFGGVKALTNVTLEFLKGEVHVVCGENGAGKSTLMNIIMGNLQADLGTISWNEKKVLITDVLMAQRLGIAIVYQERSLANALSIAENIFCVDTPTTNTGLINYRLLNFRTQRLLNELGLNNLSPATVVGKLSVAQKQMVEIAKAIAREPALLILDEPTASLTEAETGLLFKIIRRLKAAGTGIIYISHRMHEIKQIADKISVLKDGRLVNTVTHDISTSEIIRMMVGRDLQTILHQSHTTSKVKLEVNDISGKGFSCINFQLFEGEVLGFAGLEGSGRGAMAKAIVGDEVITSGTIRKQNKFLRFTGPAKAYEEHIVYLPEDRKAEGLFPGKSIAENIFACQLKRGFYNVREIRRRSELLCKAFGIRMTTVDQGIMTLSGGNQQKVMLAKCMTLEPEVLIINEPTHGVDAGAKAEIYSLLANLTRQAKSILLISSELPELIFLSDRIAVMHEGRLQGILSRNEATEERITALASGVSI
jgi:ABC-type sugar transport system ATPase subunit